MQFQEFEQVEPRHTLAAVATASAGKLAQLRPFGECEIGRLHSVAVQRGTAALGPLG